METRTSEPKLMLGDREAHDRHEWAFSLAFDAFRICMGMAPKHFTREQIISWISVGPNTGTLTEDERATCALVKADIKKREQNGLHDASEAELRLFAYNYYSYASFLLGIIEKLTLKETTQ